MACNALIEVAPVVAHNLRSCHVDNDSLTSCLDGSGLTAAPLVFGSSGVVEKVFQP